MINLTNIVLIGIVSAIVWYFLKPKKKAPPGPSALPLIGNLHQLTGLPHEDFSRWAEQYGNIFQIYMAQSKTIVLSDVALIKKAFQHPNFTGRTHMAIVDHYTGDYGINTCYGPRWQEQRRFTLRHLREFGFGKNYMESLINDETTEFIDNLKENEGKSISLNRSFSMAVLNSLWRLVTGQRFSHNDPKLNQVFDQLINGLRGINAPLTVFFPKLAQLFPNKSGWNRLTGVLQSNIKFVRDCVKDHQAESAKQGDNDEAPKDFIDAYELEIKKTTDPSSSFYGKEGAKSLTAVVANLFNAGSMTTSTTLTWAILYLIRNPKAQQKLQEEIDSVIGKHRKPTLADRPNMPYTEAVIHEVFRMSSLLPLAVFHMATEDTLFEGYEIEKGTSIIANLHHCHHNPALWGDPNTFRPERFLNSDETKFEKPENVLAFSTGKRVCIGETLARDTIFLFLTSIYQRFEIKADEKLPEPSLDPVPVFDALEPNDFFVVVKDRVA